MVCECPNDKRFIFDKEDYPKIKDYFWSFNKKGQVISYKQRKAICLTHVIFDIDQHNKKVLFLSSDHTDYRKSNLFAGNTYVDFGTYYEGTCYDGQKFKIDKEDFDLVSPYVWHVDSNGYVISKISGEVFKQHRFILGLSKTDPREVDHIHHDQLDNRKSELRLVSRSQNCQNVRKNTNNTTGVKGVYRSKNYNKWMAQITSNGKKYYLGSFETLEEATIARRNAEKELHGEYACKENI